MPSHMLIVRFKISSSPLIGNKLTLRCIVDPTLLLLPILEWTALLGQWKRTIQNKRCSLHSDSVILLHNNIRSRQSCTISSGIHGFVFRCEIHQNDTFFVPENGAHDFVLGKGLFELLPCRRGCVLPFHWYMRNSCLIASHNVVQQFITLGIASAQKCQSSSKMFFLYAPRSTF